MYTSLSRCYTIHMHVITTSIHSVFRLKLPKFLIFIVTLITNLTAVLTTGVNQTFESHKLEVSYLLFKLGAMSCFTIARRWSHDVLQSVSSFANFTVSSSQSTCIKVIQWVISVLADFHRDQTHCILTGLKE